ncbi:uncharacterized protein LOC125097466 isoform X2 [Lutra lutra]|uniref:uncharacterized protein LOC125097466 isoform X2 n=1 Tax=Lutra lutra TaxID=9657 RepID=UPI001FD21F82|nr:uncharacterized protein LOC125097466 isoform X2 [Lutra lutra]
MARGASWPRDAPATPSPPACESIRWCVRGSCRGVAGQGYVAQPVRGAGKPRAPHRRGVSAAVGENKRESERDPGFAATPPILLARRRPPLKAAGRTPRPAAREQGLGSSLHQTESGRRPRRRAGEGSGACCVQLPPFSRQVGAELQGPSGRAGCRVRPTPPVCLCCSVQQLSSKTHPRGGTDSEAPAERPKSFPQGPVPRGDGSVTYPKELPISGQ